MSYRTIIAWFSWMRLWQCNRVLAGEVAEAQVHAQGLVLAEHVDVLPATLVHWDRHVDGGHALADDASFLEVDVDGGLPAILGVDRLPDHRPEAARAGELPAARRRQLGDIGRDRGQLLQDARHSALIRLGGGVRPPRH